MKTPMFQKRHYVAIAVILANAALVAQTETYMQGDHMRRYIAYKLSDLFRENPLFDVGRFLKAADVEFDDYDLR